MVATTREEARELSIALMERWGVRLPDELTNGWCSVVMTDGALALKVPFEGEEQTTGRLAAERQGNLGPKILQTDEETGAILMEYVPGVQLSTFGLDDETTIPIFLNLALKMRRLDPTGLPDLSLYYEERTDLIERLLATAPEKVFLHADLHHSNILGSGSSWKAIDPLGFVGDPAFEAVAFLRNPLHSLRDVSDMEPWLERRILSLSEGLATDPNRIWAWSLADRRAGTDDTSHHWGRLRQALENLAARFSFAESP